MQYEQTRNAKFAHIHTFKRKVFSPACNMLKELASGIGSHARRVFCSVDLARPAGRGLRKSGNDLEVFRGVSGLVVRFWAGLLRACYEPCRHEQISFFGGLDRRESYHLRIAVRASLSGHHGPISVYGRTGATDFPTGISSRRYITTVPPAHFAFSNHSEVRKPRMGA